MKNRPNKRRESRFFFNNLESSFTPLYPQGPEGELKTSKPIYDKRPQALVNWATLESKKLFFKTGNKKRNHYQMRPQEFKFLIGRRLLNLLLHLK